MAEAETKKERFYRIGITDKEWRFLAILSPQAQNRLYKAVKFSFGVLIHELKAGKPI